jgi:hypothetical protein
VSRAEALRTPTEALSTASWDGYRAQRPEDLPARSGPVRVHIDMSIVISGTSPMRDPSDLARCRQGRPLSMATSNRATCPISRSFNTDLVHLAGGSSPTWRISRAQPRRGPALRISQATSRIPRRISSEQAGRDDLLPGPVMRPGPFTSPPPPARAPRRSAGSTDASRSRSRPPSTLRCPTSR